MRVVYCSQHPKQDEQVIEAYEVTRQQATEFQGAHLSA